MSNPLTPSDCDLRDFQHMQLDVVRLRDSDLAAMESPEACWAAVLLWCASWHQVPAASLPDDDRVLANLAGYGRVVKEWMRIRSGALRGWVKCSDNRLYHPVVAEKANEAWDAKLRQRWRTECARIKKHNDRHGTKHSQPTYEDWLSSGCPLGQLLSVPRDKEQCPSNVPRETLSKGEGEGEYIYPIPQPQAVGASSGKDRTSAVSLETWLENIKSKGEQPIPPTDPVFAYAEQAGIPMEHMRLAWAEFRARYTEPGAKRYRDWRTVYRKAVRGNWFKLWFCTADGEYALTTTGTQALRTMQAKQAAREGVEA